MNTKNLSKITGSYCSRLLIVAFTVLFSLTFTLGKAQNCTSPPSTLSNGNFDLPTTAITPNSVSDINNVMPGWYVSHGTPTTSALPNRTMWMWSYSGGGEGVFNCYKFVKGQSYLICFDLQTNGKADGATVDVRASSSLSASTGSTTYPVVPNELIWQDLVANYTYANWTHISVVYTPTSDYSQIWFHPFWSGNPPGTPAPEGNPDQSEMRIDNVNISPLNDDGSCPCDLTANYTYSATDSCAVQFNDASSGNCCTNILGWQWDFGDGTTATGANPSHTFPGSGTYTVCLTIVGLNSSGDCCTDSICQTVTVQCDTCECGVDANYKFSTDKCTVNFGDLSTSNSCSQITGWLWDFGDGTTSSAQNPSHTYGSPGTYVVCLTTYGTGAGSDCKDYFCDTITVECDTCHCGIDAAYRFSIDKCTVYFGDISTPNSCTHITGWKWDFGDGATSGAQNPVHTYGSSGSYIVCLTVYGTDGTVDCEDYYCDTITVQCDKDCPCTIDMDIKYSISKCDVKFSGIAHSDCPIVGWQWDFGDGTTSSLQNPTHSYSGNGTYTVCLTVLVQAPNGAICSKQLCVPVTITDCFPVQPQTSGAIDNSDNPGQTLPFEPRIYPNPTSGALFIEFDTQETMNMEISVFSVNMQLITTLVNTRYEAGHHKVEWAAKKNKIAPGTYYIQLKSGSKLKFEKVILTD